MIQFLAVKESGRLMATKYERKRERERERERER